MSAPDQTASPILSASLFPALFHAVIPQEILCQAIAAAHPRGSGVPKLDYGQFTMGLVWQALAGRGTLGSHMKDLFDIAISEAALSGRKQSIGWEYLALTLGRALKPMATPQANAEAFHAGLRLVGVDMTKWNLANTAAINGEVQKARSPKGNGELVAFAQMNCEMLVEIGTLNPLGVALCWDGTGELNLARELLASVPEHGLLLQDRLYGSPWYLKEQAEALAAKGSHFLARVKEGIGVRPVRVLEDGSQLVEADVVNPHTGKAEGVLQLREITAHVTVKGEPEPTTLRLWTSLLDARKHPAMELVRLYHLRWKHELYYREMKGDLHDNAGLLKAQTMTGAALEVLSLVVATALLARQRLKVAVQAKVPVWQVSFGVVMTEVAAFLAFLQVAVGIITEQQAGQLAEKLLERLVRKAVLRQRKPRRCQRAVRQPVCSWPKVKMPTSAELVVTYKILPAKP